MDYFYNVTYLSLEGHVELEKYRYVYFVICLTVYTLIICCNVVVISIIYTNKRLHEPMYIFIAALLCNALFGTTTFYPKVMSAFLSEKHVISHGACLFQAFCAYTYGASEFTLLSAMAYDRYVSICKPLQYATLVKMSTVKKLLFFCWFVPSFCLQNSKEFRRKALQTCFPHFVIFINFSVTSFFEVINTRLEGSVPHIFAIIMSVQNGVIPPLLNPIVYGLKMQEILNRIKGMIWKRKTHVFAD
ncbi:putative olfactory receptor 13C6 [Colossoma macropomum]|uniref:putative olfactory receptor 13C6 n=1 Tax=Colossoma macropomum TaxID=42526 RepID=UPI0018644859|nr:putative olfactory receptor 13C6 [Colossoma macropomum]